MKKQKKLLLILISIISITLLFVPILSFADESTITATVSFDQNNNKKVNLSAVDTTYNIIAIKYVDKEIPEENYRYFLEEHDDIHTLTFTPAKEISTSFEVDGYGTHTIYIENGNYEIKLLYITNDDPNLRPEINITPSEKTLNISVSSPVELQELKIAKIANSDDTVDFDTTGTTITFTKDSNNNNLYTATYTVSEDGYYLVNAKNTSTYSISRTYVGKKFLFSTQNIDTETYKITDNSGKLKFSITTYAAPLQEVGIVDKSLITNVDDISEIRSKAQTFQIASAEITGEECPFEYPVTQNTTFVIYAVDKTGNTFTHKGFPVVVENKPTIDINVIQNATNSTKYTITATDDQYNITEMKVKKGDNVSETDLKSSGESLTITPGKTVTAEYTITESCTLNIYVKDSNNYEQCAKVTITIHTIQNPLTITSTNQGSQTEAIVNITATDTEYNITTLKYAKGDYSENYETYFANNGTALQITSGKTVNYTFKPTESGSYTFYAEDEKGNKNMHLVTITITPITPVPTDLSYEIIVPDEYSRDKATITLKITPAESAPSSINYNGQTITLTNGVGTFEVTQNGNYTMQFSSTDGDPITKTFTVTKIFKLGDINDDGDVNLKDLLLLRRHIASSISTTHDDWILSGKALASANIDMDSKNTISLLDVLKLRRYLAAKQSSVIAENHPEWLNL